MHSVSAPARVLGLRSASMLVVASMIGTGVFTTTGLLLSNVGSVPAVVLLWLAGGLLAMCGALAYAELTAALPENGGEYSLLRDIYHPAIGFVAGWISLIVGFSAPIAAAAVAFGAYVHRIVPSVPAPAWAVALVALMTLLHAFRVRLGAHVQDAITIFDMLLVLALTVVLFVTSVPERLTASFVTPFPEALVSGEFAIGLVYVSFSYSGWNAAAYVAGEVSNPGRTLPSALIMGTAVVTLLYVALNTAFLTAAPAPALAGAVEVGYVSAKHALGAPVAAWVSVVVAAGLATTVGALIMTGPRVYERMGHDHPALALLTTSRSRGGPVRAIALQTSLATVLAATASFELLLTYIGFTLTLSSALTVAGVFVLRRTRPQLHRPYRVWGHPWVTLLALGLMLWMVAATIWERPLTALFGVATIAVGWLLYVLVARRRTTLRDSP